MPTLSWQTRAADIRAAGATPYHALVADDALSHGETNDKNILIQGDNLLALKSLVPHYAGAVKCVYIDPPFNTGSAFDDYDDNLEHTKWLEMMWPPLELLRKMLAEDGSIWVSLDSHEGAYLKIIMDEIFGRKNFVAFITNTTAAPSGLKAAGSKIFRTANHIYAYAKNAEKFKMRRMLIERGYDSAYRFYLENPDAPYTNWNWTPVKKKVAACLGYESHKEAKRQLSETFSPEVASAALDQEAARFAIDNAERVFRTAAFGANNLRRETIEQSRQTRGQVFVHSDDDSGCYILNGEQMIFYDKNFVEVDGKRVPGALLTDVWTDISWTGIAGEGGVKLKNGKKPERLIERVMQLATQPGDLVLDSFLGSGTTAAVAHKMERRWIGIENGEHAKTHCAKRLRAVVDGDDAGGITTAANWRGGGGFRFLRLGEEIFLPSGKINPDIGFGALAGHIWFQQTATPLSLAQTRGPFLGARKGVGYALLFNGIIKDKSANGGNALVRATLARCRESAREARFPDGGRLVIWGNSNRLRRSTLRAANVEFRQTPYEIKTK